MIQVSIMSHSNCGIYFTVKFEATQPLTCNNTKNENSKHQSNATYILYIKIHRQSKQITKIPARPLAFNDPTSLIRDAGSLRKQSGETRRGLGNTIASILRTGDEDDKNSNETWKLECDTHCRKTRGASLSIPVPQLHASP